MVQYKHCEEIESRVGSLVSEVGIRDTANFLFVEDEMATKEASEFLPSIFLPLTKRYKLEPGCQVESKHLPTVYVETPLIASFSRFESHASPLLWPASRGLKILFYSGLLWAPSTLHRYE